MLSLLEIFKHESRANSTIGCRFCDCAELASSHPARSWVRHHPSGCLLPIAVLAPEWVDDGSSSV